MSLIIFWRLYQLRICVPLSAPDKRAQKHNLENPCPIIPITIIGLFNPPWFLPNFGPKLDFLLTSSKRLHGRVDPSRHPPAITLHPVLHPAGPARDTKTKSHPKIRPRFQICRRVEPLQMSAGSFCFCIEGEEAIKSHRAW